MPVVAVVNPKGGVGKTTLATNLAGYYATNKNKTMLGDIDRQQSAKHWLGLRPNGVAPIETWDITSEKARKWLPTRVTHSRMNRRLNSVSRQQRFSHFMG